jgi:NAD(P)-dependent dehydrogenase (short-subunit alcohol dehydrogenase family)
MRLSPREQGNRARYHAGVSASGANVAIFARDEKSAKEVIADLEKKYGGKYAFYKTDISDMQNCRESVAKCIADFTSIDILVNNAGIATGGDLLDLEEDLSSWFRCFDVDMYGAVRMCYLVCKHMRDMGKGGRVINITSNAGEICNKPSLTSYASAKAALNHFTRALPRACQIWYQSQCNRTGLYIFKLLEKHSGRNV